MKNLKLVAKSQPGMKRTYMYSLKIYTLELKNSEMEMAFCLQITEHYVISSYDALNKFILE